LAIAVDNAAVSSRLMDMKTPLTQVTEDQIDDYIASQYMAMRAGNLDSFTARLMRMSEEAEALGNGGGAALMGGLRATARWEIEQE
jgi:hypothetical protein